MNYQKSLIQFVCFREDVILLLLLLGFYQPTPDYPISIDCLFRVRKNLKKLYIIHPSLWPKLMMQTFGAFLSPKFFKKLTWVNSLTELSRILSLQCFRIPKMIFEFDSTLAQTLLPLSPVFGVDIKTVMGVDNANGLPLIFTDCYKILSENSGTEGLFRLGCFQTALLESKKRYDIGAYVDLMALGGVHLASSLIKLWFREFPNPVFPQTLYSLVSEMRAESAVKFIKDRFLPSMEKSALLLFSKLAELLFLVHCKSSANLMPSGNLALMWAPNLLFSDNPLMDLEMCCLDVGRIGFVLKTCIEEYPLIFP
jgi:hypothetical protein